MLTVAERRQVRVLLSGIHASRCERNRNWESCVLAGLLDGGDASKHNQVSERNTLAAGLATVELLRYTSELKSN